VAKNKLVINSCLQVLEHILESMLVVRSRVCGMATKGHDHVA
jgi:hypothetical protein